jgi:hypothetical protein
MEFDVEPISKDFLVRSQTRKVRVGNALWDEALYTGTSTEKTLIVTLQNVPIDTTYVTEVRGGVINKTPEVA